jgi:hypothetical protein
MPRGSNFQKPYPPEFRREAVVLYRSSGRSLKEKKADYPISLPRRRLQRLVAPLAQQALGDVVLAAELGDRAIASSDASTISSFCFAVNFRYFLCSLNPISSLGRTAHPEPTAGRSLRRYTPPGSSVEPTLNLSTRDRGAGQQPHHVGR